ncbi:YfbM family protein [Streptomyces sp. NPDC059256]|uniref:YfbM family protein n=1 Tax=Streptomyces sp. NPDC059256 TaxID=3346794 RepID=UPI0036D03D57
MSMIGEYVRVTAAQLDQAIKDPEWASDLIDELIEADWEGGAAPEEDPSGTAPDAPTSTLGVRSLDVDKAWDALDFLLRRRDFPVDIIHGEAPIPGADDWGYGPPRYLTPARVQVAADALRGLTADELVADVSPQELARADVYPRIIWERGESLDYVRGYFAVLVPFFQAAAQAGDGMLIWLD